ncbi:unnamed protein product [Staurois parvus]|uniref:Uncharacterized protein n=1 Tax=Staurois parvus TaxID=386267 RepID=A0ABN9F9V8_9NEOB|nr:unnamed protein product [Staurois parvus]
MPTSYFPIRQTEPIAPCTCSVFFSWKSSCDQNRANQHCPYRGQGFCILLEQKENSYKL